MREYDRVQMFNFWGLEIVSIRQEQNITKCVLVSKL